jgi:hypothetical protein
MAYPRKLRFELRRERHALTREENKPRKLAERQRRAERMIAAIKAGQPYSPDVKSWVSRQLGKSFRTVTADDLARLSEPPG